jgi:hypothetical protein
MNTDIPRTEIIVKRVKRPWWRKPTAGILALLYSILVGIRAVLKALARSNPYLSDIQSQNRLEYAARRIRHLAVWIYRRGNLRWEVLSRRAPYFRHLESGKIFPCNCKTYHLVEEFISANVRDHRCLPDGAAGAQEDDR